MPGTPVIILTGGIASGKSTVAAMLAEEGGAVISADALAREVLAVGSPGWREVVDAWGAEVLTEKGEIDRRRLARRVFPLPEERRRLEAITHPRIFALLKERLAAAAQRAPFVV
ncbi:MAG TPA: dephospho-CoA kinase, partial [Firmicutes bacterium]|nr:dephospho-CoA kinase [Bacillota bacterium]